MGANSAYFGRTLGALWAPFGRLLVALSMMPFPMRPYLGCYALVGFQWVRSVQLRPSVEREGRTALRAGPMQLGSIFAVGIGPGSDFFL